MNELKYLITSSLLDGYDWLKSCPKNWKDRATMDFTSMIKREPRPITDACQRGIDFENLVCSNCNEKDEDEFKEVASRFYESLGVKGYSIEQAAHTSWKVAKLCKGGKQQVPVMKDIVIGNDEYHLFGYVDILFPDKIIDIKTTNKYTEGYNYVKRSQHYLYSLCTGVNKFEYLVADYKESLHPHELHQIEFDMTQDENLWVLKSRINECVGYIKDKGLFDDYCNIFTAQHDDFKKKGE